MAEITVRARAVDMLGRQQIAGIPTAIHELFKNAHDAYATRVEVDFFRKQNILMLRDNGYGMTLEDFESRWLTLGTESKLGANESKSDWPALMNMPKRPITGEKGIGRLAVAVIGPTLLVLSRGKRRSGFSPVIASMIHWPIFEVPGLNLDEIQIPTYELAENEAIDENVVQVLRDLLLDSIRKLRDKIDPIKVAEIESALAFRPFSPEKIWEANPGPSLTEDGHGTHFFVIGVSDLLEQDIDDASQDGIAPPLQKELVGFSNTLSTNSKDSRITAEFRDHLLTGEVEERIGDRQFFTLQEFESADHHFTGRFDEYGQFSGEVSIFGEPPIRYNLPWTLNRNEKTACGPFSINVAYVHGLGSETRMPHDQWVELAAKLDRIGGIYIFRDGIRILPYGNSDYDFLGIERRRTKAAKDWFFSYRRVFGVVETSHSVNPNLQEKAGREGFRANLAYRQFRLMLENFIKQLAIDFFRDGAKKSDVYRTILEQHQKDAALLKKREEMGKEKVAGLKKDLDGFFNDLEQGTPKLEVSELEHSMLGCLNALAGNEDHERAARELIDLEDDLDRTLKSIRAKYKVARPRGISLRKNLAAQLQSAQRKYAELESDLFEPMRSRVQERISGALASRRSTIDRAKQIKAQLDSRKREAQREIGRLKLSTEKSRDDLDERVKTSVFEAVSAFSSEVDVLQAEFQRTAIHDMSEEGFERYRLSLVGRLERLKDDVSERLNQVRTQLDGVVESMRAGVSVVDLADAAGGEMLRMSEELDEYLEFAQAGMSVGIIQHEFSQMIDSLRKNVRRLDPWADGTPDLAPLRNNIRTSLEHLDGYLNLFTPLSRRMRRTKTILTGNQIYKYLREVFDERMDRHAIRLLPSDEFKSFEIECFPSSFLPVFMNLLDNAIYWIGLSEGENHWIKLDAEEHALMVSNSGMGVDMRFSDQIFEFGVSLKDGGGRGMGLYISRKALAPEGWDIELLNPGRENNPLFRIFKKEKEEA